MRRKFPLEELSLESPELPQMNLRQSLILNQTATAVRISPILQANFAGTNGSDIVSAYTPDKGGAFSYVIGGVKLALDGSGNATINNGTGSGASGAAVQDALVADIPSQATLSWAWHNTIALTGIGMVLRYIDSTHWIGVYYNGSKIAIAEKNGGGLVDITTGNPGSLSVDTFYQLTVTAVGTTVTAKVNNVQISATVVNTTGTKFGPYANGNAFTWAIDNIRCNSWLLA